MRRRAFDAPGQAHGLTFSCYRRARVFDDSRPCETFLEVLDRERRKLGWEVWAYVLMPDHVHLLVWPGREEHSVSAFLRAVKQPVSTRVLSLLRFEESPLQGRLWNEAEGKHRLWQPGGGHDRNLWSRGFLSNAVDYIHHNPVRAGLAKVTWEYRWSSAAF